MFKDLRLAWTDCDEAEDYGVPNVLSPRDLVFRPDIMDETVKSSYFPKGDHSQLPKLNQTDTHKNGTVTDTKTSNTEYHMRSAAFERSVK